MKTVFSRLGAYATLALFAVAGAVVLPLDVWAWRWTLFAVALVLGFVLASAGAVGAGDAKFFAAILPFVAFADLGLFAVILSGLIVVTFLAHRLLRGLPAVRARFAHWDSITHRDFPMGIALAPAWIAYLAISAAGA